MLSPNQSQEDYPLKNGTVIIETINVFEDIQRP
jgi:hypothetical protein